MKCIIQRAGVAGIGLVLLIGAPACEFSLHGTAETESDRRHDDGRSDSGDQEVDHAVALIRSGSTIQGVDTDQDGDIDVKVANRCNHGIDRDGDGEHDAVDLDCDGKADLDWCEQPFIDRDGNGSPEGIDCDCDGTADIDVCVPTFKDVDGDGEHDMADLDCDGKMDVCEPQFIDENGDKKPDGIDTNCDGKLDERFREQPTPCQPKLIDKNQDGRIEGVDLDCDGDVDVPLPLSMACKFELIDRDSNGVVDGFDLQCSPEAAPPANSPGSTPCPGGTSPCQSKQAS